MVINLHVTERCNYRCRYCFGHWGVTTERSAEQSVFADTKTATKIMTELANEFTSEGGLRFNFVGGEPGLLPNIADLVDVGRALGARTSYVTNGLMLRRFDAAWTAANIDVVGLSVDSAHRLTNRAIGRMTSDGRLFELDAVARMIGQVRQIGDASIKVNTVVSRWNVDEDFSDCIASLGPERWKVLKMLPVHTLDGMIDDDQFRNFLTRHLHLRGTLVAEDNDQMTGAYVMVDPLSRFFWYAGTPTSGYCYSRPIVEVGAARARRAVDLDTAKYAARYLAPSDGT